jgi:hypothetical protein
MHWLAEVQVGVSGLQIHRTSALDWHIHCNFHFIMRMSAPFKVGGNLRRKKRVRLLDNSSLTSAAPSRHFILDWVWSGVSLFQVPREAVLASVAAGLQRSGSVIKCEKHDCESREIFSEVRSLFVWWCQFVKDNNCFSDSCDCYHRINLWACAICFFRSLIWRHWVSNLEYFNFFSFNLSWLVNDACFSPTSSAEWLTWLEASLLGTLYCDHTESDHKNDTCMQ